MHCVQTTPTEDRCPRLLLVWPSYSMCRWASNNVVNSETGEWRVGQLQGTQSAEYALCGDCGWSSDTNREKPRENMLALHSSLRSPSLPVIFEVSTPPTTASRLRESASLNSVLTAAITNHPNRFTFWWSHCRMREHRLCPIGIYNIGSWAYNKTAKIRVLY